MLWGLKATFFFQRNKFIALLRIKNFSYSHNFFCFMIKRKNKIQCADFGEKEMFISE
jgi:hypothetical protein